MFEGMYERMYELCRLVELNLAEDFSAGESSLTPAVFRTITDGHRCE